MALDILLLLFLFAVFFGCRFTKGKGKQGYFSDYLSGEYTGILKGVFCLSVVFHHLAQRTEGSTVFVYFQLTGYLSVALFFFLSGYGLMARYKQDGSGYLKGFFKYRFCAVAIPLLLFLILYSVAIWYCERLTFGAAVGKSIYLSNSWFMVAILFFYICFFIAAKLLKRPGAVLIAMLPACGLFLLWRLLWNPGEFWWYNSFMAFVFGILWALYHQKLTAAISRFFPLALIAELAVFIPCFALADSFFGTGINIVLNQAACLAICALVFTLALKIKIGNSFLRHLGRISTELYLVHGLIILCLRCSRAKVPDDILFTIMVLAFSLALAEPLHRFMQKLIPRRLAAKKT